MFQHDIEKHDNRGRTPLMLAVTLGHTDSAAVLLHHEANVNTENTQGWSGNFLLYSIYLLFAYSLIYYFIK